MGCTHEQTHTEDWPDGGKIEVCDKCGSSRYLWEQGESEWVHVDLVQTRKKMEKSIKKTLRKKRNESITKQNKRS